MNSTQAAEAHFNLASDSFQRGCYVQAIQHYEKGLEVDPARPEAFSDLSKAFEMVGRWDDALDCLQDALKLRADYPVALRRKERIVEEKQVYEALIHEYTLDPQPPNNLLGEYAASGSCPRIKRKYFVLECEDTIPLKTAWFLCQLIDKITREVGELFKCYPPREVSIVLEDFELHDEVEIQKSKPVNSTFSFSGVSDYGGHIRLTTSLYGEPNLGLLLALIRHEWVHLLVDLLSRQQCPSWFNEGLAQILARPFMQFERARLREAHRKRQLLGVDELQQQFGNMPPDRRRIAYLQSTGFMEYLVHQNGISPICDFLRHIGNGVANGAAFQQVFGGTDESMMDIWKEVIDRGKTRHRNHRARDPGRRQVFPRWLYA
ncbi:MAG: tetratricopeptide repeat protein [Candidatus Poribacteria bacterium]|nr:tetratricopeptide repeat protein [Candidatus Poribacteria bacterium]MDE0505779.1 tetratricopeptide repeat protein [Candidatus Poribacteria bacterium]